MMDFATLFELPVTKLYPWCDFSHCLLTAFQAKKDFKELHRYTTGKCIFFPTHFKLSKTGNVQ